MIYLYGFPTKRQVFLYPNFFFFKYWSKDIFVWQLRYITEFHWLILTEIDLSNIIFELVNSKNSNLNFFDCHIFYFSFENIKNLINYLKKKEIILNYRFFDIKEDNIKNIYNLYFDEEVKYNFDYNLNYFIKCRFYLKRRKSRYKYYYLDMLGGYLNPYLKKKKKIRKNKNLMYLYINRYKKKKKNNFIDFIKSIKLFLKIKLFLNKYYIYFNKQFNLLKIMKQNCRYNLNNIYIYMNLYKFNNFICIYNINNIYNLDNKKSGKIWFEYKIDYLKKKEEKKKRKKKKFLNISINENTYLFPNILKITGF